MALIPLRVLVIARDDRSHPEGRAHAALERRLQAAGHGAGIDVVGAAASANVVLADLAGSADARRATAEQPMPLVWWLWRDDERAPEGEPFVSATATATELVTRLGAAVSEFRLRAIRFHGVEIDLSRRRVVRAGQDETLTLTLTEAGLLRELAGAEGRVVPRDALLRRVWGYRAAVQTRALDIALVRLRAKVEPDPAHPSLILTLRGQGYRLATEGVERDYAEAPATVVRSADPAAAMPERPPFAGQPFFGRAEERRVLAPWLAAEGAVVSLVGPPGSGRARLAAKACEESGGTLWQLSSAEGGPSCSDQLLRAARLGPRATLEDGFAAARAAKRLIVWVQVERHEGDLRPWLERLRQAAPATRLILTARSPIDLPEARHLPVHGLDPEAGAALLLDRWQAEDPFAVPTADDHAALRRLAELVDGLPLALEILAGALATRRPTEVLLHASDIVTGRVSERLGALLQAALTDLDPDARAALDVLARFAGPVSPADAEVAIHTAFAPNSREGSSVTTRADAALRALLQRALLQRRSTAHGTRLLVARRVAEAARTPSREADLGFLASCARLGARSSLAGLYGPEGLTLRAALLEREVDFRVAAEIARRSPASLPQGLDCLRALAQLGRMVGPVEACLQVFETWLDLPDIDPRARAELEETWVDLSLVVGRTPPLGALDDSLARMTRAAEAGDREAIDLAAGLAVTAGYLAIGHRDVARVTALSDIARRWADAGAAPEIAARVCGLLTAGYSTLPADQVAERLRDLWLERQRAGDLATLATMALWRAGPLWRSGRITEALEVLRTGVRASQANQARLEEARDLGNVALLELTRDEVANAELSQRRALSLMRATGTRQGLIVDLANLAEILHVQGDRAGSRATIQEALAELAYEPIPRYHVVLFRTVARLALAAGRWEDARAACARGRGQVDVSSRALSADLDALDALAAEALGAGEPGVVDRLLAAAAEVDDVGTALRVSGIAAILARWSGTRADEARAVFEREATRAETEPRRDVRAIRRALEAHPRSGCDLL